MFQRQMKLSLLIILLAKTLKFVGRFRTQIAGKVLYGRMGNVNKAKSANSAANEREERTQEASSSVFSLENQTEQLPQHRVLLKDASPQNLQNLF